MSVKVRFTLAAEPSLTNSSTTVPHVISVQVIGSPTVYAFPENCKDVSLHHALMELPIAKLAKKDLKPRWTRRSFNVTLDEKLSKLYFDDDENPIFNGCLLSEFEFSVSASQSSIRAVVTPRDGSDTPAPVKSLTSVVKDAVIPKFGAKTTLYNADSWIQIFEGECKRLLIEEDRFWEVLRLFLEGSAEKWYHTMRLSTTSLVWSTWRDSFLENFGTKSLAAVRSAYFYRYVAGSISDYAQTKLNMLASCNPKMHESDKIAHLALGLPRSLQDRINLAEITSLGKMLSTINSFNVIHTSSLDSTRSNSGTSNYTTSTTPCPYCKKKGYERFHYEKDCLTKSRDQRFKNNKNQNSQSSNVNNNVNKAIHSLSLEELQHEINTEQKNE